MHSIVNKIRHGKICGVTALIIILCILWQIGSYLYWEATDDLYDKERVNSVLIESGLEWEVSRRDELGEKMIVYYLKDPKLEPPTLERTIMLSQRGRVKYTELHIQNVMGGARTSPDKKYLTTNDDELRMAFVFAAKIHGNGADGEKIYEQFIEALQNGKTHQSMENKAFYDWQNKVDGVYCYVFYSKSINQENAPILVQDIRFMNRYGVKIFNYAKS
ncbi:MAG: hypothetical protein Q4D77_01905 [Peptostreptococcaceae bacterium]|nr:hypothetical protein [Peptostreptococcaceae bacterium]